MYRGPQVATFAEAPRAMPQGVLPVDGIHFNAHFGQPAGMPDEAAAPPMDLHAMSVDLRNPLAATATNLSSGRERFETACAPCHGLTGAGNGTVARLLAHPPPNLIIGVIRALPDGYIYGYIRDGSDAMPSYAGAMSSGERWQVVLYVRELERRYRGSGHHHFGKAGLVHRGFAPPPSLGEHRRATDTDRGYVEIGSDSP
jgi:mono/diheme cytochrome c family protein